MVCAGMLRWCATMVPVGRERIELVYAEFCLCSGEQDLGTVEVAVVLGCKEIKAGDLKARSLELRSLPHGYLHRVR